MDVTATLLALRCLILRFKALCLASDATGRAMHARVGRAQVDLGNWNQDERFGAYGGAHAMVMGGYSQLTDAMAAHVKQLHYNAAVSHVTCTDGSVKVVTRDGREFLGDTVIVSVPVGVLKQGSISFSPALPMWKQEALGQIGMGKLNKARLHPCLCFPLQSTTLVHLPTSCKFAACQPASICTTKHSRMPAVQTHHRAYTRASRMPLFGKRSGQSSANSERRIRVRLDISASIGRFICSCSYVAASF
jgi:hypothetical protein